MIDVRQRGESIEITDTPSPFATAMTWFARVCFWLGLGLVAAGLVATVVAIAKGGAVWRAFSIVPQALVLGAFGWFGSAAWRKIATARRTVIDRARGSIELAESSPGGTPYMRSEIVADVLDVAIESCETTGPERSPLRLVRLWLRLRGDRRMMIGDVGDLGGAKQSLERAAGLVAGFLGVVIARESTHEVAPTVQRTVVPRGTGARSLRLMTWRQQLLYVPGIAVILCGTTYVVLAAVAWLGGDTAKLSGARTFVLAISPLMMIIPAIPMLALGGVLHVRVEGGRLELVRSRAGVRGAPVVVLLGSGEVALWVRELGGRTRGVGRLVATQDGRDTVLVEQASVPALRRVADDLAAMLGGAATPGT